MLKPVHVGGLLAGGLLQVQHKLAMVRHPSHVIVGTDRRTCPRIPNGKRSVNLAIDCIMDGPVQKVLGSIVKRMGELEMR